MEMQFKNEIKKLADVVVWADNWINNMKVGLTDEEFAEDEEVRAFETVKKVVLESMERHAVYTTALNKDIADKAAKIDLLEKEIEGRKEGYIALKVRMDTKYISIDDHNDVCKAYEKKVAELEKESEKWQDLAKMNRDTICDQYNVCEEFKKKITELENEIEGRKKTIKLLDEKVERQRENLNALNKTLEIRTKENERLIAVKNNQYKEIEAHESENARLSEKIIELKKEKSYLKKELNETCTCKELDLKGHNRREMALVNDLADKNDEIKKLEESIDYYKNQERIRTDQLRATERKVDELWGLVNELKKEKKEGDDYAREGFKLYVKNTLAEAEGDKNEANEVITEAVRSAYAEWGKTQKENEETIKKAIKEVMNKKYGYAGEIAFRIRSEVDKKRIVDIGEGAEKILGVSRELFDAAIKTLVDDGYQEIIGRIPQATNSYVYMDMHVLATPDVETKETANAENIKSLDFDIPCGEDSIE